jgi:hypothetical protein
MTVLGLMLAGIVGVPVVTACVVHGWHGLRVRLRGLPDRSCSRS